MARLHRAFNVKYEGVVNTLVTPVLIRASKQLYGESGGRQFTAVWDTGATHSCISHAVAKILKLPISGKRPIKGVNSEGVAPTYFVDLLLPSQVTIAAVEVAAVDVSGCDILIGMDVISLGDLTICNHGGTEFSFSIPAHEHKFDLVERSDKVNKRLLKGAVKKPR
ncbi:MAG: retroviral-like aspartic protease family protein [Chthoniobacterales bacterium]